MRISSEGANDFHLAPQSANASGSRGRLGSVYQLDSNSRVVVLSSDDPAGRHSRERLLSEAVKWVILGLTRFTDPDGTPISYRRVKEGRYQSLQISKAVCLSHTEANLFDKFVSIREHLVGELKCSGNSALFRI